MTSAGTLDAAPPRPTYIFRKDQPSLGYLFTDTYACPRLLTDDVLEGRAALVAVLRVDDTLSVDRGEAASATAESGRTSNKYYYQNGVFVQS